MKTKKSKCSGEDEELSFGYAKPQVLTDIHLEPLSRQLDSRFVVQESSWYQRLKFKLICVWLVGEDKFYSQEMNSIKRKRGQRRPIAARLRYVVEEEPTIQTNKLKQ